MLQVLRARTVVDGPFKGMVYPDAKAVGSVYIPKIIGSYERELSQLFARLIEVGYSDVVDIGCAEGYYAVGLALRMPAVRVYGFDTDPRAIEQCTHMAELNGVADRVVLAGCCDQESLKDLPLGTRALIISDCEGFEGELFDRQLVTQLVRHDFLIEVHDFIDPDLSLQLRDAFCVTHDLEVVRSIDDLEKVRSYDLPVLKGLSGRERFELLRERRPCVMEWYFFSSRGTAGASSQQ